MNPMRHGFHVGLGLILVAMCCGGLHVESGSDSEARKNSLGMKFVPVPGTQVLFSIWETRIQDYQAFIKETGRKWELPKQAGFLIEKPALPVVFVTWEDAVEFCRWLTKKELAAGQIKQGQEYRLPTDEEWSKAVGLPAEEGASPGEKNRKITGVYPWGKEWPPKDAGNYLNDVSHDQFPGTASVGSFAPNSLGLYDMGGNAAEWCSDLYDKPGTKQGSEATFRVQRGASWADGGQSTLISSFRFARDPLLIWPDCGFRCVLTAPPTAK